MIPHPAKAARNGEDACYISKHAGRVIAVADGVGGWAEVGVDPGEFARKLLHYVAESEEQHTSVADIKPEVFLQYAYEKIHTQRIEGSSTACVLVLHDDHLSYANLGDSGFMVVRGNQVPFRSKEQTHEFNFPYQLGSKGRGEAETPRDAKTGAVPLQKGDVIVVGTDGLFDNLYDTEIVEIVRRGELASAVDLARELAQRAHNVADNKTADTPFAAAASKEGLNWPGGKMDDISVIVAKKT
jgi:protein phosphatase PTC7